MNDAKKNAPALPEQEQRTVKVNLCIDSKAFAQVVAQVFTPKERTLEEQLQLLSERSMELGFEDPVQYLCSKAKEVRQTEDSFEAIRLISTGSWAIASGLVQDGKPNWILVRYA